MLPLSVSLRATRSRPAVSTAVPSCCYAGESGALTLDATPLQQSLAVLFSLPHLARSQLWTPKRADTSGSPRRHLHRDTGYACHGDVAARTSQVSGSLELFLGCDAPCRKFHSEGQSHFKLQRSRAMTQISVVKDTQEMNKCARDCTCVVNHKL